MNDGAFYGHSVEREHRAIADDEALLSDMSNWAVPEYPRNQVDKAGATFIRLDFKAEEFLWAISVINNWRSSHSYPLLHFRINLKRNLKRIEPNAIVAQRIKRLESKIRYWHNGTFQNARYRWMPWNSWLDKEPRAYNRSLYEK